MFGGRWFAHLSCLKELFWVDFIVLPYPYMYVEALAEFWCRQNHRISGLDGITSFFSGAIQSRRKSLRQVLWLLTENILHWVCWELGLWLDLSGWLLPRSQNNISDGYFPPLDRNLRLEQALMLHSLHLVYFRSTKKISERRLLLTLMQMASAALLRGKRHHVSPTIQSHPMTRCKHSRRLVLFRLLKTLLVLLILLCLDEEPLIH